MILSREEIEQRINAGELLVVCHGRVLKLNHWLPKHPGGDKAILHMVGRDASDEIDVYHSAEALKTMPAFSIGTVEQPWVNLVPPIQRNPAETPHAVVTQLVTTEKERDLAKYPPLDEKTQLHIQAEFRELHAQLEEEGFFVCHYWGYAREAARISLLFALCVATFCLRERSLFYLFLSAVFLGLGWHQLVFIVHDAGHLAITHNYYLDNILGSILASYIGGLSMWWWKRNHNVHHLVTNDPVHDPDIQHLPFFAVTSKLFNSVWSTYYEKFLWFDAVAQRLLPLQHYLYYPILCFGRFNLYRLSWVHVLFGLGPREGRAKYFRHFELVGLAFFTWWFWYLVVAQCLHTATERLVFVMVSHIVTMPVHVQITLSHFAQSTSDLGPTESFPQKQIRTTMDVACPAWLDFVHGGLQFQAIHHLFPRMPRHNFRAAQPKVIEFCNRLGLHYEIYGFTAGNQHVIGRLQEVAQQAVIFSECNQFCKKELLDEVTQLAK